MGLSSFCPKFLFSRLTGIKLWGHRTCEKLCILIALSEYFPALVWLSYLIKNQQSSALYPSIPRCHRNEAATQYEPECVSNADCSMNVIRYDMFFNQSWWTLDHKIPDVVEICSSIRRDCGNHWRKTSPTLKLYFRLEATRGTPQRQNSNVSGVDGSSWIPCCLR